MLKKLDVRDRFLILAGLAGLIFYIAIFPSLYPESSIDLSVSKDEIAYRGKTFVQQFGTHTDGYRMTIKLRSNEQLMQYLNKTYGTKRANLLIRDSVDVFYWTVQWAKVNDSTLRMGNKKDEEIARLFKNIQWHSDLKGNMISFRYKDIEDKENAPSISMLKSDSMKIATDLASQILQDDFTHWNFDSVQVKPLPFGAASIFTWHRSQIAGLTPKMNIEIFNNHIISIDKHWEMPEHYASGMKNEDAFQIISFVLVYLSFIILSVFLFTKRLRSDLLDLKSGLIFGVLVLLGWLINFWTQMSGETSWELLVGFIITAPFVGGGIWLVFALGESFSREVWSTKLLVFDRLRNHILFRELGVALIRGLSIGGLLLGVTSFANLIAVSSKIGFFQFSSSPHYLFSSTIPGLFALGNTLLSSLYIIITYCLFFVSLLRTWIHKRIWIVLISVFFWSFISIQIPDIMPYPVQFLINAVTGLILILFFIRYDFITILTASVVYPITFMGIALLHVNNGFHTQQGLLLLSTVAGVLLWGLIAYRKQDAEESIPQYVPEYLQRISEKQRIHKELEIARNIQLSFLPRKMPEITGLQVATFCLPAREVGGDYFDFVELGPRKIGIAIGDVSGKGIPAAFYMTLMKGMLKSHASRFFSPKDVLVHLNTLFYENAERGIFISMIYSVFDLDQKTLTFARAGHNPMILRRSDADMTEELCPPGIALGFEKGDIFEQTIEESIIPINDKDVFLFYTDGLNEAQNRVHHEFGTEKLIDLMQNRSSESAEEILKMIELEIQNFTKDAPQHDDMTALVIKITD